MGQACHFVGRFSCDAKVRTQARELASGGFVLHEFLDDGAITKRKTGSELIEEEIVPRETLNSSSQRRSPRIMKLSVFAW